MASSRSQSAPSFVVAALVVAGLALGFRATQLALADWSRPAIATAEPAHASGTRPSSATTRAACEPAPIITPELRAMVQAACPHAIEALDELEAGRPLPTADHAYPRLAQRPGPVRPGLRVAQTANGWLVPPDNWYSPEDQQARQAPPARLPDPAAAPVEEPVESSPAVPATPPVPAPSAAEPAASLDLSPADALAEPDDFSLSSPMASEPARDFPASNSPTASAPAASRAAVVNSDDRQKQEVKLARPVTPDPADRLPEPSLTAPQRAPTTPEELPAPSRSESSGDSLHLRGPQQPPSQPSPPRQTPAPAKSSDAVEPPAERPVPKPFGPRTQPLFAPPAKPEPVASPSDRATPLAEPIQRPSGELQEPAQATPETVAAPPAEPKHDDLQTVQPAPARPQPAAVPGGSLFAPPGGGLPTSLPRQLPAVSPHAAASAAGVKAAGDKDLSSIDAHTDLFAKNCYPSARDCAACHEQHYEEWRISSHAYAMVSPMFQKFEQRITELSQGTVGYFCYRCHSPVATSMGYDRTTPLWEMTPVAQEGVTCIACHRINERYTKANGERRVVPGDIHAPVYGSIGGSGVAAAIAKPDHYKVKTSPDQKGPGQAIHLEGRYFDQLGKAEFCTSCHQVAVHPGIKLEVVWEQYRQSPAACKGVTCQDCHMGLQPGEASGYEITSIAQVGGKSVNKQRKHANHIFYGPNYSISHPGVFPDNKDADRWKMHEWLQFNWRAGWGTDDFEEAVDEGRLKVAFPAKWADADDRYDAREVIEDNLKALARKDEVRHEVMSHGLHITGPHFGRPPARHADLRLHYDVTNLNEGHNVLTASLGAQPQLWANVVLIGPTGRRLWESGYTDSDGDVCDIHSRDVQLGRIPFDHQLFNLQTMFLITGATGTDREMPLPVNVDIDQLPFLRPGAIPITTTNHPPAIRMESRSIAPLGTKRVHYKIPGKLICQPGKYRLSFRMRNRIEPIWFMRFCNATDEMVRAMNQGVLDIHPQSVEFWVR